MPTLRGWALLGAGLALIILWWIWKTARFDNRAQR